MQEVKRKPRPKGTGYIDTNGYHRTANVLTHRIVAEKALGKRLQPGSVVHHVNGDVSDNSNENLVICPSQAYHLLIHQRQDALAACGNANYRKCRYCKEYDDPIRMYDCKTSYFHIHCKNRERRAMVAYRAIKSNLSI